MKLLDGTGAPTGKTALTDDRGNVSFTGLAYASYEIAVVTPTGNVPPGTAPAGPLIVPVGTGESRTPGYAASACCSGSVFNVKPGILRPRINRRPFARHNHQAAG